MPPVGPVEAGPARAPEPTTWRIPPSGALVLGAGQVDLWRVPLTVEPPPAPLFDMLSTEERLRAGRLGPPAARSAFVVGRATLRLVLARYLGAEPAAVAIRTGPNGKPVLSGTDALWFNVAHAGQVALYALAHQRRVGIDVELLRSDVDCLSLARRFFVESEYRALRDLPERDRRAAFFAVWTAKEAILKATGQGLGGGLAAVEVALHPEGPRLVRGPDGHPDWWLQQLDVAPGYAAAVALDGKPARLRQFRVEG